MKTFKSYLFLFVGLGLLISCSKSDDVILNDDPLESQLKSAGNGTVTVSVPFKVDLSVWDQSDYSDPSCGGPPVFFITMEGDGNITHLGLITTRMTFCADVSNGHYYDTDVIFVAANGDKLYASIPDGQIVPNEEDNSDYYQTKFNDPMYFTGGTGRFEGASGMAYTNAYVHDGADEWRTDFFSTGTLILVKGKRSK